MGFPSPDHPSLLADVEWTLAWGPGPTCSSPGMTAVAAAPLLGLGVPPSW